MKNLIIGLGEALWDMLPEGKKLGGAPANFAYHAGQFGLDTVAISALGEDKLADETIEALEQNGLKYLMPRVPYATGTVQVTLTGEGIPTYEIKENVAWDNIPFNDEIKAAAKNCRAVCFGSLAQRNIVSRQTIQQFLDATPEDCIKICDINLRQQFFSKEILDDAKICEKMVKEYNLQMLVLTCGTNGSHVFTADGKHSFQPTPKVEVADTVGAGDSFTGSFCAAILNGKTVEEAHRIAVEVSAYVCTQNGAMPKYPAELVAKVK